MAKNKKKTKKTLNMTMVIIIVVIALFVGVAGGVLVVKWATKENAAQNEQKKKAEDVFMDGEIINYQEAGYIELGQYKGLKIDVQPTEEDVEAEVDGFCEEYAKTKNYTVKKGDTVTIDYDGTVEGKPFDGGTAEEVTLKVGDYEYMEDFENGIIGKKVGTTVTVPVAFPADYDDANVAGKTATFKISITAYTPEFTDAFVKEKTKGKYKTAEAYREKLKKDVLESNIEALGDSAWEEIKEKSKFKKVPTSLQEAATAVTTAMYTNFAEMQGGTVEDLLESMGMTEDDIEEVANDYAYDWMIARTIASIEGLKLDDAYYKEKLAEFVEIDEDEFEKTSVETLESDYKEYQSEYPKDDVMLEKVKEFIAEQTTSK